MATNLQIITDALQELGIVPEGDEATAAQGEQALRYLNRIMAEYQVGDGLSFAPQDTLSDTCPIPLWAENAIVALLAGNLASPMRVNIRPELVARIDAAATSLRRTLINLKLQGADMSNIHLGSSRYWNINTGTW